MKNCSSIFISGFLILIALACGIWLLSMGIGDTLENNQLKAEYETVEGHLSDYTLDSPGGYDSVRRRHKSATYFLTYTYFVDDMPYTVTTDYSTGNVPTLGSARTVYYSPADPENAILGGNSGSSMLILLGAMFILVPVLFIVVGCSAMGWLPKTRIDLPGLLAGGITVAIAAGFLSMIETGGRFNPFLLIPWLMIAAGVWLIIRGLFFSGKETKRK